MELSPADVGALVENVRRGDQQALATLMPIVYDEMRRLAASATCGSGERRSASTIGKADRSPACPSMSAIAARITASGSCECAMNADDRPRAASIRYWRA